MIRHLYMNWSTFIDSLVKNRILRNGSLGLDYKKKEPKNRIFLLKQLTMHKQDTNNSILKQLNIYNKFLSSFQQVADKNSILLVYLINSHNEESCADTFPCLCLWTESLAQSIKRHLADGDPGGNAALFLL